MLEALVTNATLVWRDGGMYFVMVREFVPPLEGLIATWLRATERANITVFGVVVAPKMFFLRKLDIANCARMPLDK